MFTFFIFLLVLMVVGGIASLMAVAYFKQRNEITEHYRDRELDLPI